MFGLLSRALTTSNSLVRSSFASNNVLFEQIRQKSQFAIGKKGKTAKLKAMLKAKQRRLRKGKTN
ncbi:hypothetical protein K7432_000046 [Basidiobolus ranarum]|uniref:Uncharacterized protein n=1 Tax=Basidiobolus ranarum TaxID=34480 RepID=A0ABR2X540_9FUNG